MTQENKQTGFREISDILPEAIEMMEPATKESTISIEDWEKWFPEFETLGDRQRERMKQEALRFGREAYDRIYHKGKMKPRWLSLLGTSGTGKTMLARKVASRFYSLFPFVLWVDVAAMVRKGQHDEFLELCRRDVLVVDDIFSEYRTDFSDAKLTEFFTRREYKWTMITANLSMESIAKNYDQRIASRMIRHNSVVVDVDLPDFNLR